jgi:hypothetical protein
MASKMIFSLPMITKALLAATPEEVAEWMAACQQVAPVPAKKGKKSDDEDSPRRVTNSDGPTAWNMLLAETWHEMAAVVGVDYASFMEGVDESDEKAVEKAKKAFGKAAGAKGVGYQAAMKEASRRKKDIEGAEEKPKKTKKVKTPVTPPPSPAEAEEDEVNEMQHKFAAEQDMTVQIFEGALFLVSKRVAGKKGSEAFFMGNDNKSLGERAGLFMWETKEVDYTE